jgi:hypothetical protein
MRMSVAEKITRLYTTAEYADLARTTPSTVRHWRATGYGPKPFRLGRKNVYVASEVDAFIASLRNASTDGDKAAPR